MKQRKVVLASVLALCCVTGAAWAEWTITGTATTEDNFTGVEGVIVKLHPTGTEMTTDANGDFLMSWTGEKAYLTLTNPLADPLCKRIALFPKPATRADSTLDLGGTVMVPTTRWAGRGKAMPPPGSMPPDSIRIAGPATGEPDSYWMVMRIVTDMYGTPTSIDQYDGEMAPAHLQAVVIDWLRSIPWIVHRETACDLDDPFRTMVPVTYWYRDGMWQLLPNRGRTRKEGQELREASKRDLQGLPPGSAPVDSGIVPRP